MKVERAAIALVLRAVSRPRGGFELPRFAESRVIVARLEELVIPFHVGFEVGLLGRSR